MTLPLQNDHNVYILGAGFSREAGLPLISDFLVRMRDCHEWLQGQRRASEADAVSEVLKFRLGSTSAAYGVDLDLENIEELFSLASSTGGKIITQIRLAIAATLDYARKTSPTRNCTLGVRNSDRLFNSTQGKLPEWIKRAAAQQNYARGSFEIEPFALYVARLLGMFNDGNPKGLNSFISFNYDTLLEEALGALNLQFCYGFSPKSVNFSNDVASRIDDTAIRLLKLHGSVNWARRQGRGRSLTVFKSYEDVRAADLIPELVPPTWKKVFEKQLEDIWETAINQLSTATRIVIIGFSMPPTDTHFKYLVAAGLQKNISLRQVLFVNPDKSSELEPRAQKLFRFPVGSRRIAFAKKRLSEFTARLNPSDATLELQDLGRPAELGLQYDLFS